MDALMAALVAALLAQTSDRQPWLAARLAAQSKAHGAVIAATALALAISNALGALAGALMAPILTPNARALLLCFALLSAGASCFGRVKPVSQRSGMTLGAFLTAFITLLAAAMGDRTQFLTAAIAARSDVPVFAAIGATIGALAVHLAAIGAGERAQRRVPMRAIRIAIGLVLMLAGTVSGLSALRLI